MRVLTLPRFFNVSNKLGMSVGFENLKVKAAKMASHGLTCEQFAVAGAVVNNFGEEVKRGQNSDSSFKYTGRSTKPLVYLNEGSLDLAHDAKYLMSFRKSSS